MRSFSVESASRNLIRTSLAIFTIVVLILVQSIFWSRAVSVWMRVIVIAIALVSYFRPHNGLLILAALTPLGQVGSPTLNSQMRGAEALVLAFLAGALVRGWTLHRFRGFPSSRLHIAVLLFGFVVAASCIEQIWFLQVQSDFAGPFLLEAFATTSRNYVRSFVPFGMIFRAMLLLEGLALLVYVAHYCQRRAEFAPQLVRMVLAGFVAAASCNILFFIDELIDTGAPTAKFMELLTTRRFSGHVGDVNAAGSFFAMAFFIALGRLTGHPASRTAAVAAVLIVGIALWLTQSRAALVVALLIGVFSVMKVAWRSRRSFRATSAVILLLAGLSIPVCQHLPLRFSDPTVSGGIKDRWLFLSTTIAMLQWQPLFGVGVGQYVRWSGRFAPPDLLQRQGPDNAHNNFAQVAGELGIAGLVAFASVLAISLWPGKYARERNPLAAPIVTGVVAFILTWLGGHPLLVPEVAYPFWITLAIVPGLLFVQEPVPWKPVAAVAFVGLVLFLSIPSRIESKQEIIDFSRITYGVSEGRTVSSRATLFVPAASREVSLPVRARDASPDRQIAVDLLVDDKPAEIIRFTDDAWQTRRISFSSAEPRRFHTIELRIQDGEVSADDESRGSVRRSAIELGEWNVIASSRVPGS
jgi:O-Antigen ligase